MTCVSESVTDEREMNFDRKGKLASKYNGPFKILERINVVAYRLVLPPDMSPVHPVFHVSMLRKYISDHSHVLQPHGVEVNEDLTYKEESVAIVNF